MTCILYPLYPEDALFFEDVSFSCGRYISIPVLLGSNDPGWVCLYDDVYSGGTSLVVKRNATHWQIRFCCWFKP